MIPQTDTRWLKMPEEVKSNLIDTAAASPLRPAVDKPSRPFDEYTVTPESANCYSRSGITYRLMVKGEAAVTVYHFCCTAEEMYDCERDCPRSTLGMRCRHRDDLAEVLNRAAVYSWRLYQFDWTLNIQIKDGPKKCDPCTATVLMKARHSEPQVIVFALDGSIT